MVYFLFAIGLTLLIFGSNYFVEYASRLARFLSISPVVFGTIVVALGTSLPELAVTIDAAVEGHSHIIVGNILGSNIANIGLVLGLSFAFAKVKFDRHEAHGDAELMFILSIIFIGLLYAGLFSTIFGLVSVMIAGFITFSLVRQRKELPFAKERPNGRGIFITSALLIASLTAVLYGSRLTVTAAIDLASIFSVPEELIAATMIAIGTSLPELTVTIAAIKRKKASLAVGNIIGSNIYNIALIGGVGAIITSFDDDYSIAYAAFFLVFTVIAYLLFRYKVRDLKPYGILILSIYGVFLIYALFTGLT